MDIAVVSNGLRVGRFIKRTNHRHRNSYVNDAVAALRARLVKAGTAAGGLYEKGKDNWIGIVLRRDAYNKLAEGLRDVKLRQMMRPLQLIPDSLTLDKLLLRFLKQRGHIVGVVDEWGAIAGIVSLEDVLEEILGREIVDEYDENVDLQETARRRSKALARIRQQSKMQKDVEK